MYISPINRSGGPLRVLNTLLNFFEDDQKENFKHQNDFSLLQQKIVRFLLLLNLATYEFSM